MSAALAVAQAGHTPEVGQLTLEVALAPRDEYLSVGLAPNVSLAALEFTPSRGLTFEVTLPRSSRGLKDFKSANDLAFGPARLGCSNEESKALPRRLEAERTESVETFAQAGNPSPEGLIAVSGSLRGRVKAHGRVSAGVRRRSDSLRTHKDARSCPAPARSASRRHLEGSAGMARSVPARCRIEADGAAARRRGHAAPCRRMGKRSSTRPGDPGMSGSAAGSSPDGRHSARPTIVADGYQG
jgi:hypothetical protein